MSIIRGEWFKVAPPSKAEVQNSMGGSREDHKKSVQPETATQQLPVAPPCDDKSAADFFQQPPYAKMTLKGATMVSSRGRQNNRPSRGLPPQIRLNEKISCVRRFYNNAAVAASGTGIITTDDVFGAILQVGRVANTSTTCVATSFRIKKVCIYPPATSSGSSWVDLIWGSPMIDNVEDKDMNLTVPYNRAAVDGSFTFAPPKGSTAGGWINQTGASATIMYLTLATAGSVVDVHLEYTTPTGITASGTTLSHSGVTVGSFYRGYLNSSAGADTLVPVDFTPVT